MNLKRCIPTFSFLYVMPHIYSFIPLSLRKFGIWWMGKSQAGLEARICCYNRTSNKFYCVISFQRKKKVKNAKFPFVWTLYVCIFAMIPTFMLLNPGQGGHLLTRHTCTIHGDHHNHRIIYFALMGTSVHQSMWIFWWMIFLISLCIAMKLFARKSSNLLWPAYWWNVLERIIK